LRPIHAAEKIDAWLEFAKKGAHQELATALMQHHYDPRYAKKGAVKPNQTGPVIALADLSEKSLDKAANALVKKIENQGR
ncbi:MAG: tRNA 2-selenouridine synthase, partial [Paracoccaceae bacterium]